MLKHLHPTSESVWSTFPNLKHNFSLQAGFLPCLPLTCSQTAWDRHHFYADSGKESAT